MLDLVPFSIAVFSTCFLAFATPNIFFAGSAFSEPTAQFFTVLALFLFFKGFSSAYEWIFFVFTGLITGLNLFVQPVMAAAAVPFAVILVYEYGRGASMTRNLLAFLSGFIIPLAIFLTINRLYMGRFIEFIFSTPYCPYNLNSQVQYGSGRNIIVGIWKLLFDSPQGLVFIMPIVMLVPSGFIALWRNEQKMMALFTGILVLITILFAAANSCPVSGECVGSRHLVPILPLLVIPVIFIWEEDFGEKIWFGVTFLLTVYMCTFGWWTGISRGEGFFIGVLQDRDARVILLARNDRLKRPVFTSSNELEDRFLHSLKHRDMKEWLQTLDHESIMEIYGFERVVFNDLVKKYQIQGMDRNKLIQSVDPDRGIQPVIPELHFNIESEPVQIF
jgi:hypothetical protein